MRQHFTYIFATTLTQLSNPADCHIDLLDFIPGWIIYDPCLVQTENALENPDGILGLRSVNSICGNNRDSRISFLRLCLTVPESVLPYFRMHRYPDHILARRRGCRRLLPPHWYTYHFRKKSVGFQWQSIPDRPVPCFPIVSSSLCFGIVPVCRHSTG